MTKVGDFQARVDRAVESDGGVSKSEWTGLHAEFQRFAKGDQAKINDWLQTNHSYLSNILGNMDATYDSYSGPRTLTYDKGVDYSADVKRYIGILEGVDAELDLRNVRSKTPVGVAKMKAIFDAIGKDKIEDFVTKVIVSDDSHLWFNLSNDGVGELAWGLASVNADPSIITNWARDWRATGHSKGADRLERGYEAAVAQLNVPIDKEPNGAIGEAVSLSSLPTLVSRVYDFSLSKDRKELTVDPKPQEMEIRTRGASRGIVARDSERGGKIIQLVGGPFKNGEWVRGSYRALVNDGDKLEKLAKAGYDLNTIRDFLVVQGENDDGPTIFAFSMDARRPGLVAVCEEVTVLDMDGSGGPTLLVRKPVIYLYPKTVTDVRVEVSIQGRFAAQYPKQRDGRWEVSASPDGVLFDRKTERKYGYLFWEGTDHGSFEIDLTKAFSVHGEEAESFLENACSCFALTAKEKTDFISYWLPHLERNELNLVQLLSPEQYEKYARMVISPEPDTVIRMFMVFKKGHGLEKTSNPDLPQLQRSGFTVVEWGGVNLDETV